MKESPSVSWQCLTCALLLFVAANFAIARQQVAIIVNAATSIDTIDARTLLDIYSLNARAWDDNTDVVPLVLKGNTSLSDSFYRFIGEKPLEMRKLWLRAQLSGEGKAPQAFDSEEQILEKVISTPGAIGFVSTKLDLSKVKILLIIR